MNGRVVTEWARYGHPPSDEEQAFIDWAIPRGHNVVLGRVAPLEDDEEPFEPFNVMSLCMERRLPDGRIAVQCIDISEFGGQWPEQWELMERMCHEQLERLVQKEELVT